MNALSRRPKDQEIPFTLYVSSQYERNVCLVAEAADGVSARFDLWSWGLPRFDTWRARTKARRQLQKVRRKMAFKESVRRTFEEVKHR